MELLFSPRSVVAVLTLFNLSGCAPTDPEGLSQTQGPDNETSNSHGDTEQSSEDDGDTAEDATRPTDSIVCADEDSFALISELPSEISPFLLTGNSFESDGTKRSFSLRSVVEDEGLFLWFGSEADEVHNVLHNSNTSSWTVVTDTAHEPRLALNGQFLAFERVFNDIDLSVGHRFDPISLTWTPLPPLNPPLLRQRFLEIKTEGGYFVWGGYGKAADAEQYEILADGGYLDASTWSWTPVSIAGAPSPRSSALIASADGLVLVYGGLSPSVNGANPEKLSDGFRYDPALNSWSPMSALEGLPQGGEVAVGFSEKMLVIGSHSGVGTVGAIYDAPSDSWSFANMMDGPHGTTMLENITPAGWVNQLVFLEVGQYNGDKLFIYDVQADSWRSHAPHESFPEPSLNLQRTPNKVGKRGNMDYFWHAESLFIWGGHLLTLTECDAATRAAMPENGCDALEQAHHFYDGLRLDLSCPSQN